MGIRFRQSMKLAPGVRLNFSKETMGLSFGVPGARYTINTKGRRTISTGIPGTGIYNVETLSSGRTRSKVQSADVEEFVQSGPQIKPWIFSPRHEKEFYKFLLDIYGTSDAQVDNQQNVIDKGAALKEKYLILARPVDALVFLHAITSKETSDEGEKLGTNIWTNREDYFENIISRKYFEGMRVTFYLTQGIAFREKKLNNAALETL